jgi:peptidoglycan hydrolase-like protein with peptidoglycan-binding domain
MAPVTGPAGHEAADSGAAASQVRPAPRFRSRRAARRGLAATAAAALVAAVSVAGYRAGAGQAAGQLPAGAGATSTAAVVRTTLVSTDSESGTLGYAQPRTLEPATGGIVTRLPQPGTVIRRDQILYGVSLRTERLFYGQVPLTRTLAEGVPDGPDIRELQSNLRALGYDPNHALTIDDHFSAATTAAVQRWQAAHGLAQTGQIAVGDVAFLPGPVRIGTEQAGVGDTVGPGRPLMQFSSTQRVVTVNLPTANTDVVADGDRVTLLLPNGATTTGTISDVGKVATAPSASTSQANSTAGTTQATITVTIRVGHQAAVRGLDQAPVTVYFARQILRNALAVPVTALVTRAGGGFAVDLVRANGTTRRVAVQAGMFATNGGGAGQVQISGPGIAAGQKVAVPR